MSWEDACSQVAAAHYEIGKEGSMERASLIVTTQSDSSAGQSFMQRQQGPSESQATETTKKPPLLEAIWSASV